MIAHGTMVMPASAPAAPPEPPPAPLPVAPPLPVGGGGQGVSDWQGPMLSP
jgi:hypothetical protein